MDESKSLCSFTKGMIFWGFFLLGLSDDCEVVSPSTGKQGKKVECWMKVSTLKYLYVHANHNIIYTKVLREGFETAPKAQSEGSGPVVAFQVK